MIISIKIIKHSLVQLVHKKIFNVKFAKQMSNNIPAQLAILKDIGIQNQQQMVNVYVYQGIIKLLIKDVLHAVL